MTDESTPKGQDNTGPRKEAWRRGSQGEGNQPRSPKRGFYAASFSDEEIAGLELISKTDVLENEIALLRIIIRRKLRTENEETGKNKEKEIDADAIRQLVDTLCRAIRVRHSAGDKSAQNVEDALATVVTEVTNELDNVLNKGKTNEGKTNEGKTNEGKANEAKSKETTANEAEGAQDRPEYLRSNEATENQVKEGASENGFDKGD